MHESPAPPGGPIISPLQAHPTETRPVMRPRWGPTLPAIFVHAAMRRMESSLLRMTRNAIRPGILDRGSWARSWVGNNSKGEVCVGPVHGQLSLHLAPQFTTELMRRRLSSSLRGMSLHHSPTCLRLRCFRQNASPTKAARDTESPPKWPWDDASESPAYVFAPIHVGLAKLHHRPIR